MPRTYEERLEYNRQWRAKNPDKVAGYLRKQYEKDRPSRLAYAAEQRKNTQYDPEKQAVYNRRWREKHPGALAAATRRWKEANREEALRRARERENADPAKRNAKAAAFRALRLKATPPWFEKEAVAALYREASEKGLHVDHIYPLRGRGICGLHCLANLQLLTPEENMKKGNRWKDEHNPQGVP